MAELVDAPASGAGGRKAVEVRVLFWAPFFFPDASASVRENPRKQRLPASLASIGIRPNSLKLAVHDGISDGIKTDRGGTMLTDLAVRKAAPRDKTYKLSDGGGLRSEEHTSELQSQMRISY